MPGLVAEDKLTLGGGEHVRRDRRAAARVTPGDYQRQHLGQGSATAAASPGAVRTAAPPAPPPPSPRQSVSQPDVDPCSQSPVGGCIRPPTKVRDVKPRYPQNRRGSKATVLLEGRVGTDGFLKDLRVLAPADAEFADAALAAVRQWQFTPTRLDGVPMEVRMRMTVNFFMDQ